MEPEEGRERMETLLVLRLRRDGTTFKFYSRNRSCVYVVIAHDGQNNVRGSEPGTLPF